MICKNNKGVTLVELLVTLAISLSVMGLISGVLFQSNRSKEIGDSHINLRQEANIILSMFSSTHSSAGTPMYDVNYTRVNADEWVLKIGNQQISSQNYNIAIDMEVGGTRSFKLDPNSSQQLAITIEKKQKLNIKSLQLIDKKNPNLKFEISTFISRM